MTFLELKLAGQDALASFTAFKDDPFALFLDSAGPSCPQGRYSFICAEPDDVWQGYDDPFALLSKIHRQRQNRGLALAALPFASGLAGFLAYEAGRHLEHIPLAAHDPLNTPDFAFGLFESVVVFDHHTGKAFATGPKAKLLQDRIMAAAKLPPCPLINERINGGFTAFQSPSDFKNAIEKTRQYIAAGDIFQANMTQGFLGQISDPFAAYLALRHAAPGPFSAYLTCGDFQIASVSPERFLKMTDGVLEARPIKGTAKRHPDPAQDQALANALRNSAKDRAENLMILDLMRNDLGKVAEIGSVHAPQRMELETFAAVHHLVSVVRAKLRPDLSAPDALKACFPPGSITGAPKIRAQEIIAQLEPLRRGAYCGALGYISDCGNMDFSVLIRTLAVRGNKAGLFAGGGITWGSDPQAEFEESMVKAGPLLNALGGLA